MRQASRSPGSPRSPLGTTPSSAGSRPRDDDDGDGEERARGASVAIAIGGAEGAGRREVGTLVAVETSLSGSYEEPTYMPSSTRAARTPLDARTRSKSGGPRDDGIMRGNIDDMRGTQRRHRHASTGATHSTSSARSGPHQLGRAIAHDTLAYWSVVNHQPGLFLRQPAMHGDTIENARLLSNDSASTSSSTTSASPQGRADSETESDFSESDGSDFDADGISISDAEDGDEKATIDETTYLLPRNGISAGSEQQRRRLARFIDESPPITKRRRRRRRERSLSRVTPNDQGGCTTFAATVSIMKLVVGVGSYALPKAFSLVGFVGGMCLLPTMAILCAWSISLLIDTKKHFPPTATYVTIARSLSRNVDISGSGAADGLFSTRSLGIILAGIINAAIIVASIGGCTSYIDFTTPLLSSVLGGRASHLTVVLFTLPVWLGLAWIRDFRYLSLGCMVGEASFVVAILTIGFDGFSTQRVHADLIASFDVSQVPHFLGAASFLFAICLFILPVEQAMRKPDEFMFAVKTAFSLTTAINMLVGGFGFLLWGTAVQDVIVNSLKAGPLTTIVKLLLFVDISFTFPIVLAPGREFVENALLRVQDGSWSHIGKSCVIRALLVVVIAAIALLLPNFLNMLSMVGGLALISTTLMVPPILYVVYNRDELGVGATAIYSALSLIGFAAAAGAVYAGLVRSV